MSAELLAAARASVGSDGDAVAKLLSREGTGTAARYEAFQSAAAVLLVTPTSSELFRERADSNSSSSSSSESEGDDDGDEATAADDSQKSEKKKGTEDVGGADADARLKTARGEFDAVVAALRAAGVVVVVSEGVSQKKKNGGGAGSASSAAAAGGDDAGADDDDDDDAVVASPEAVFAHEWVSTHNDADVMCVYSMRDAHRRTERMPELVRLLQRRYSELANFARFEIHYEFLQAGDLAMDRLNRVAYRCAPDQVPEMAVAWESLLGFVETERFLAAPGAPQRTNLILSLGTKYVIFCGSAVGDDAKHRRLLDCFSETEKTVVEISLEQAEAYCANTMELRNADGETFICMSKTAHQAFTQPQLDTLRACVDKDPVIVDIPTIEAYGGTSVRSLMAEIF